MQMFAPHTSPSRCALPRRAARRRRGAAGAARRASSSPALARRRRAPQAHSLAPNSSPSFVVIQTDDQTLDQLYASLNAGGGRSPGDALHALADRRTAAITFNRYYVPYPLCCPSRVSLLTGRYAHNHNVRGNVPPNGGYTGFKARHAYTHNLATWLQGAGYRTIHIGKFLNGYGDEPYDEGNDVPPGWNAWHTRPAAPTPTTTSTATR